MSVAHDQAKLVKQRNEIARLTQKVEKLANDLKAIKADRDLCKEVARAIAVHPATRLDPDLIKRLLALF